MNAGDVVWIEFPGVVQTKRRPAVVLSSSTYHASRPDIIVGLVTSQISKSTAPTDFVIQGWQAAGLRVPSAFRALYRHSAPLRGCQPDWYARSGGLESSRRARETRDGIELTAAYDRQREQHVPELRRVHLRWNSAK